MDNVVRNQNLSNVNFVCGGAEKRSSLCMSKILDWCDGGRSTESGLWRCVIDTMLAMSPGRIVYVYSKPSTLARDLKRLCESGVYHVEAVQPYDVFGHTGRSSEDCGTFIQ